jgi:ketosteroid isomerase-like protein
MLSCRVAGAYLLVLLTSASASAQNAADQLRATEQERLRALVQADVETADRLHADDFQLINPLGGSASKAEYLGAIASGEIDYLSWEPETIEVKLYGDVAVIRYQAALQIKVRALPDAPSGRFWHTDVYEKRNGRWQVVWSQATQIQ